MYGRGYTDIHQVPACTRLYTHVLHYVSLITLKLQTKYGARFQRSTDSSLQDDALAQL
jgi:hypothetical protein